MSMGIFPLLFEQILQAEDKIVSELIILTHETESYGGDRVIAPGLIERAE